MHLVAVFQQELGQVRAILAGDPGDQGSRSLGHLPKSIDRTGKMALMRDGPQSLNVRALVARSIRERGPILGNDALDSLIESHVRSPSKNPID